MEHFLSLNQMTVSEKLKIMEKIWDDLCHTTASLPSPDWHGDVLSTREQRVRKGTATFSDWSKAKQKIRVSTR